MAMAYVTSILLAFLALTYAVSATPGFPNHGELENNPEDTQTAPTPQELEFGGSQKLIEKEEQPDEDYQELVEKEEQPHEDSQELVEKEEQPHEDSQEVVEKEEQPHENFQQDVEKQGMPRYREFLQLATVTFIHHYHF